MFEYFQAFALHSWIDNEIQTGMCSISMPSTNEGQIHNFEIILKRLSYCFSLWSFDFWTYIHLCKCESKARMSGLCLEDLSPSRSREKNTFTSSPLHAYLQYIWHVELQANYQRWKGQLSEALCFSTALVSIHKNVAILSGFMFMHDCASAEIFFAWREKLVVQVSVNRLLAV